MVLQMKFCLDQSLARNEAHIILNQTKLDRLLKRENLKRKAVPNVDTGKSDTNTVSGTITGGMFIDRSSESKTDREKVRMHFVMRISRNGQCFNANYFNVISCISVGRDR